MMALRSISSTYHNDKNPLHNTFHIFYNDLIIKADDTPCIFHNKLKHLFNDGTNYHRNNDIKEDHPKL
jgi:hypothetical protein